MKNSPVELTLAAAIAGLLIVVPLRTAAAASDLEEGRALAKEWCSSCHMVAPGVAATTTDAAPPFPKMAEDPAYTEDRLRSWLWAPHPPMPDFDLSRFEIESLVAYIKSLDAN
ncbi:MAG: cytochrome c [Kiloniellales bacterium]|nr:cytochrome c [Kiloniellales bacterium]